MNNNRRDFLKVAGAAALGVGAAGPAVNAFASAKPAPAALVKEEALRAKRWGMVVNVKALLEKDEEERAEALEACIHACHKTHNVPDFKMEPKEKTRKVNPKQEIKWLWEEEFEYAFPYKEDEFLAEKFRELPFLVTCNHCKNPPCVKACPTKATFKREDGIVLMDFHRCIGCRFCMAACPYGSRSFNYRDPRPFLESVDPAFPTRCKGVVEKCNFCADRLARGEMPACVEASDGILAFGDLEDPESEVRELLAENYSIRRNQGLGTEPSVYYIL